MTTIMPTHTCFDDALDTLVELIKYDDSSGDDLRLVHALCAAPDGHLYAHAWVEFDNARGETVCVFSGLVEGEAMRFLSPGPDYYKSLQVSADVTKYTSVEALAENARTNHYGPWIERYQNYTGGKGEWEAP
jgi:hypothetical protein